MTIFNESGNIIESPNLELGRLEDRQMTVVYEWFVDSPEQTHKEVIAEYPETGGQDIAIIVDVPEQGHWEVTDEDGNEVNGFDGEIPDWIPREEPSNGTWHYLVYVPYTQEELEEFERAREEAEEQAKKYEAERKFIENGERIQDEQDEAICALFEAQQEMQDQIDEAICEMYEMTLGE